MKLLPEFWAKELISQQIIVNKLRNTIDLFLKIRVFLSLAVLILDIKLLNILENLQTVSSNLIVEISPVIALRVELLSEYFWLIDFREGFYFVNAELINLCAQK